MKKTLLSLAILVSCGAFAQTTVTFDDLTLSPDSYWSGSDGSGSFVSNGISFPNEYDMQWSYWSGGFIYSNSTMTTLLRAIPMILVLIPEPVQEEVLITQSITVAILIS